MSLRRKLLLLALVTLLLPVSAWLLTRELESFLRQGQQQALQATAATIARSLASEMQPLDQENMPGFFAVPLRGPAALDGYANDWPAGEDGQLSWRSPDDVSGVKIRAGVSGETLFLHFNVDDSSPVRQNLDRDGAFDGMELSLRSARGMLHFLVASAGTGPLNIVSSGASGEQIPGYWLDRTDGYSLELAIPWFLAAQGLMLRVVDVEDDYIRLIAREINQPYWVQPIRRSPAVQKNMEPLIAPGQRVWIVDSAGYVRAQYSRPLSASRTTGQASWVERALHRVLTADRSLPTEDPPEISATLEEPLVASALAGQSVGHWRQVPETAELLNSVATPITSDRTVLGAVYLRSSSDGMLLLTNRALGRILGISLLTTLILSLALYLFASRLSGRVRRLNKAVRSASTDPASPPPDLPLTLDRDELGELARSHGRLLRAVRDYNAYLKTLAGKLSHELKTPLVIMRSSLENMEREPLDDAAKTYLERAQEGGERLAEILRAMSDASRLENAIGEFDAEAFPLERVITQATAAYQQIYPDREIDLQISEGAYPVTGGPELIAQALDKLVNNAVSLTSEKEEISIILERQEGQALIRVRNTGTQLPAQMQDQLFESLVSVRSKKGEEPHLGLGLYLVKLIAEAHLGSVSATNLPGEAGVEFTVAIPLMTGSQ